jgi:hypothetical protein
MEGYAHAADAAPQQAIYASTQNLFIIINNSSTDLPVCK